MNPSDAKLQKSILDELNFRRYLAFHCGNAPDFGEVMSASIKTIVGCLRQASPHPEGPLAALGFTWVASKKQACTWTSIMNLMGSMDKDDGIFVMQSLMKSLPARKSVLHDLRSTVLAQSHWRTDAILAQPDLFNTKARRSSSFLLKFTMNENNQRDAWNGNPFVLLSTLSGTKSSKENVLQCIRALESAGASKPGQNLDKKHNVLHRAAAADGSKDSAESLSAFAEHFNDLIEDRDNQGFTPLHLAATSSNPEKAIVLIQAGANTRALGHMGDSPLDEAVKKGSLDMIQALIRHGDHDWQTVRRAKSWSKSTQISALLDAQLAIISLNDVMRQANAPALPA